MTLLSAKTRTVGVSLSAGTVTDMELTMAWMSSGGAGLTVKVFSGSATSSSVTATTTSRLVLPSEKTSSSGVAVSCPLSETDRATVTAPAGSGSMLSRTLALMPSSSVIASRSKPMA